MASIKARIVYHLFKRRLAKFRALKLALPQARAWREREAEARFKLPAGITVEAVQIAGVAGEWLHPPGPLDRGLLLYLHGGAYVQGSVKTHRALATRLALASGASCLIIDYRLAPEHAFPAALDDALAVCTALRSMRPDAALAVAGDSAGAGLALALALRLRDENRPNVAALALMSPWTDLTLSNETHRTLASVDPFFPNTDPLRFAAAAYAGSTDLRHPYVSPLFAEDLRGLPLTLIHVGDREALLDDARLLAERMQQEAGGKAVQLKIYPKLWHVWQAFGGVIREADESIVELGTFLRSQLAVTGKIHR